jgi:hypothetical protein
MMASLISMDIFIILPQVVKRITIIKRGEKAIWVPCGFSETKEKHGSKRKIPDRTITFDN